MEVFLNKFKELEILSKALTAHDLCPAQSLESIDKFSTVEVFQNKALRNA